MSEGIFGGLFTAATLAVGILGSYYATTRYDTNHIVDSTFVVGRSADGLAFADEEAKRAFKTLASSILDPHDAVLRRKSDGSDAKRTLLISLYRQLDDPHYFSPHVLTSAEVANGTANADQLDALISKEMDTIR